MKDSCCVGTAMNVQNIVDCRLCNGEEGYTDNGKARIIANIHFTSIEPRTKNKYNFYYE